MSTSKEQKRQLRQIVKQLKLRLEPEDARLKANLIFSEIERMEQFVNSKTVLAYWSLPDEVDTHEFIIKWSKFKRIVLPVVVGENLELRAFDGVENMVPGEGYGILEPKTGELVNPEEIDFAIIPGVAFDREGNRLGRGKGYYDKTIPLLRNAVKVGIAYEFQLFDEVPVSDLDVAVDFVIFN